MQDDKSSYGLTDEELTGCIVQILEGLPKHPDAERDPKYGAIMPATVQNVLRNICRKLSEGKRREIPLGLLEERDDAYIGSVVKRVRLQGVTTGF